jgi:small subunit ribosomal protein S6
MRRPVLMPTYETIFIAQPGLAEPDADALAQTFEQLVREGEGTVVKADHWGKRKLAYAVQKHQEGYFFYLQYDAAAGVVSELERRLRNNEQVLKYLSVKLDRHAVEALALAEKKAAEKAAARAQLDAERAARLEEGKGRGDGDLDAAEGEGSEDEDED